DDRAVATELSRVLKSGGFALISVFILLAPHDPVYVCEGYSFKALRELLVTGGFEVVWYCYCFHFFMCWFGVVWWWQYDRLGRRRNLMLCLLVLAFGYADRWIPIGAHWDLVIFVRKR